MCAKGLANGYRSGSTVLSSRIEKSGTWILEQAPLSTNNTTIKSSRHHMNLTMDASICGGPFHGNRKQVVA